MANELAKTQTQQKVTKWLNTDKVRQKFADVLDKEADGFISSLLALVNETPELARKSRAAILNSSGSTPLLQPVPRTKFFGLRYNVTG